MELLESSQMKTPSLFNERTGVGNLFFGSYGRVESSPSRSEGKTSVHGNPFVFLSWRYDIDNVKW